MLRGGSSGGAVLRDYQELICSVAREYLRGRNRKELHFEKGASSSIKPNMDWFTTGGHTPKPRSYDDQFRRAVKNQQRKKLIWNPTVVAYQKTGSLQVLVKNNHALVERLGKAISWRGSSTHGAVSRKVCCPPEVAAETYKTLLRAAAVYDQDRDLYWSRAVGPWDRFWRIQAGIPLSDDGMVSWRRMNEPANRGYLYYASWAVTEGCIIEMEQPVADIDEA
ncbi:hypothetical protein H2200_002613 [Cladophialophora chaetospira]|uniref:Uncharacterized protein n=1 Tax=Cladophialophora chaetospira TaxID=386627 RepID=A0AA38XJA4_9EURO|nr:hypothetical protein H2200_002613 [Cladophialophora chaetospira]